MKNVTITLSDYSRSADRLAKLEKFMNGPGYPGISKVWRGRAALYAEREAELCRRRRGKSGSKRPLA